MQDLHCLLSASLILAQGSQLLLCLAIHGKSPSRCTTLSTDCTTETRGMSIVRQWRQRQRKGFADDGDAILNVGRSPLHPLADKECHWGTLCFKKRESGTELQNVSCCMQGPGETGETWTYPSMVLVPLCTAMVMAWSLQGELRFPLATFHYHSLPPAS